ncbi:MAG: stage V sporulation protein AD [Clostridiaceae bacterium BRH_c20a]|nr:MAG: stage V sporulation protein AD [Clostridiaceae bacterium BRH_c20a]
MQSKKIGKQTINYLHPVSIVSFASIVGPKEGQGPLGSSFDYILADNLDGEKSWEKTEQKMLEHSLALALAKKNYLAKDLDYFLAGDLLNQIVCSNFTARAIGTPFLGIYGACSTLVEGLVLGSILIDGGYGSRVGIASSSHHETAERQLRFPTELGVQRTMTAQWTVTGSGAYILEDNPNGADIVITQGIIGKVIDLGQANAMDMGAAMAPAAADTITQYFKDTGRKPEDFDLIITGDLGNIGRVLCQQLVLQSGYDISKNYSDCGVLIYDPAQDTHAGGSGCGCSASVLAGYLLPQIIEGKLRNIFLVGTGALLSPTSAQQGETIPCIAHGIVIQGNR